MTASSGIPDPVDRQSKISCLGDRPLPVRLRLAEDRGYFPHLLPGKFSIKRAFRRAGESCRTDGSMLRLSTWSRLKRTGRPVGDRTRMQEPAHKGTPEV